MSIGVPLSFCNLPAKRLDASGLSAGQEQQLVGGRSLAYEKRRSHCIIAFCQPRQLQSKSGYLSTLVNIKIHGPPVRLRNAAVRQGPDARRLA